VRAEKNIEEILNKILKTKHKEKSDIIRELINNGSIYLAIEGYVKGKYSIGKAANLENLSFSEFMDLFSELKIASKVNKEDIIEGFENLKKLVE